MIIINSRSKIVLGLLLLTIIGWIYYHDDIFIQLTALFSSFLLFSFIWTLFATSGIDVIRKSRFPRQKVGEYFEENIEVINHSSFWHFLLEVSDLSGDKHFRVSRIIASLGPHQSRFYNTYQYLEKRGMVQLGPLKVSAGDPFGFFLSKKSIQRRNSLFVLPFYYSFENIPVHFGQLSGGSSLQHSALDATPHAAGIREYYPGDPLNRIHWPSSMKRNRLIVKEFDQNPQGSVWIFLDSQKEINFNTSEIQSEFKPERFWRFDKKRSYQLPREPFEYSVSIAASLTDFFIREGRQVGFFDSGKRSDLIPAEKGERQISKILDILTHIQADGELPIRPFVESNIYFQNPGNMIIVITTSAAVELQYLASLIKQKGLNPFFVILNIPSLNQGKEDKRIYQQLKAEKIPVVEIRYGSSIKESLEKEFR
jgi:uncharacterized protein (DUF58 family)